MRPTFESTTASRALIRGAYRLTLGPCQGAAESFGSSAIRVDGAFNPAIVNPDWLAAKGLIDEADKEYAVEPEHDRVLLTSRFSGGQYPWIVVEVTQDELNVTATDETETPERLRDFVVRLLRALPETPAHGLAVMHHWHVAIGGDRWERIAETVAPSAPWTGVAAMTQLDSLTRRIELEDGERTFRVEPSHREGYDLYVVVERYWDFGEPPGTNPVGALESLDHQWEDSLLTAERLLATTLGFK